MVLTLNDLCLVQVCNFMTDGTLPTNIQIVPPVIRRKIFSILGRRNQLSDSNCLRYVKDLLSDNDSLNMVDTMQRETDDNFFKYQCEFSGFLQFLDNHLRESSGLRSDRITTLRLVISFNRKEQSKSASSDRQRDDGRIDVDLVVRLIGQCRNLKDLALKNYGTVTWKSPRLLEVLADAVRDSGSSGLEALELFRYKNGDGDFQLTSDQALAYRRLKRIRFHGCSFSGNCWSSLLDCCHEYLECLILHTFTLRFDDLIPTRLEKLTTFDISCSYYLLNLDSLLERWPNLKRCHFQLDQKNVNSEYLTRLKSLLLLLDDCSISLDVGEQIDSLLDELIAIAGSNIAKLFLTFCSDWTADAVRRLISGCPNLHTLWTDRTLCRTADVYELPLNSLFCNEVRAPKLIRLELFGSVSERMLELFANCINLAELKILNNDVPIRDRHLEIWTDRGARLSLIHLESTLITEHGLKLLISSCGSNLKYLLIENCAITDFDPIIEALIHCCPMLEYVQVPGLSQRIKERYTDFNKNFLTVVQY